MSIKSVHIVWSGRQDLNLRPSAPKADAIPSYATSRFLLQHQLARQRGFEPLTSTFVVLHSIQLSYQRTIFVLYDFITLTIFFNNIINVLFFFFFPGGFEPSIIELQSIALPDLAKEPCAAIGILSLRFFLFKKECYF